MMDTVVSLGIQKLNFIPLDQFTPWNASQTGSKFPAFNRKLCLFAAEEDFGYSLLKLDFPDNKEWHSNVHSGSWRSCYRNPSSISTGGAWALRLDGTGVHFTSQCLQDLSQSLKNVWQFKPTWGRGNTNRPRSATSRGYVCCCGQR